MSRLILKYLIPLIHDDRSDYLFRIYCHYRPWHFLLLLPISTTSGAWNDPIVALFTSTSAV
ncbi:MAG: hypothetical protein HC916_18550, partial [Coleofasciculaceae cyanobacterium SM2_1_6]|nr:hypothetical protein [Coleofasciculaceae cyanobacterium SM2_1_6]